MHAGDVVLNLRLNARGVVGPRPADVDAEDAARGGGGGGDGGGGVPGGLVDAAIVHGQAPALLRWERGTLKASRRIWVRYGLPERSGVHRGERLAPPERLDPPKYW